MATTSAANGNPDHELHARQLAKDGLLFVSLALTAIVMAVAVKITVSQDQPELLTALAVGGASALVCGGIGVFKLIQARRSGPGVAPSIVTNFLAALYLAILFVVICGLLMPAVLGPVLGYRHPYTRLLAWSIPLIAGLVPLTWKLRGSAGTRVQRSAYATAASFLCWISVWGLLGTEGWLWIVYGVRTPEAFEYGRNVAQLEWLVPLLIAMAALGFVFLIIATFVLTGEIRSNGFTAAVTSLRPWMRLSAVVLLAICINLGSERLAAYWSGMAALLLISGAIAGGSLLAGLWQKQTVSRRRRALFVASLVVVALPLIIAAGITGSALSSPYVYGHLGLEYAPQVNWVWSVPEIIRAPVAHALIWARPSLRQQLFFNGLVASKELESEALLSASGGRTAFDAETIWMAWIKRDPGAVMRHLRSIPTLPAGSRLQMTSYDMYAGSALAILGSEEEIRAHLSSGYSAKFVDGILIGLPQWRRQRFVPDIFAYFQSQAFDQNGLFLFSRMMPKDFHTFAFATIDAPAPDLPLISRLLSSLGSLDLDLIAHALRSADPAVRRAGLASMAGWNAPFRKDITQQLIKSMEGELPGSQSDEQREAATAFASSERKGGVPLFGGPRNNAPLSKAEQDALEVLVKKAQERLTKGQISR